MRIQVSALPYRFVDDSCEILLVTSRRRGKWILPRGKIEAGETAAERAAKEAFEEAGVVGKVAQHPLLKEQTADPSRPTIFPLEVLREEETWPEMHERQRAWMSVMEARTKLTDIPLRDALTAFSKWVSSQA